MANPSVETNRKVMSGRRFPVTVHMWFEDGEGWAYHPVFKGRLADVVVALDAVLKSSETQGFVVRYKNRYLVGERVPDVACRDPRAVHRRPFIVRAALLDESPSEELAQLVRERLREIAPEARGQSEALKIRLDAPPPSPPPIEFDDARRQELELQVTLLTNQVQQLQDTNAALLDQSHAVQRTLRRLRTTLWIAVGASLAGAVLATTGAALAGNEMRNVALFGTTAALALSVALLAAARLFLSRRKRPQRGATKKRASFLRRLRLFRREKPKEP